MNHLVIPDTQHHSGCPTEHLEAAGNFIVEHKPDVVVHIGDHFDMPSLSSYDKGRASFEGRRYKEDIESGQAGLEALLGPLWRYNEKRRRAKMRLYRPRLIFNIGNHEQRIERAADSEPALKGWIGYHDFELDKFGFEVYDFLEVVNIDGVNYTHFCKNLNSSYPISRAHLISQRRHASFTVGHMPGLDYYVSPFQTTEGSRVQTIIAGSYYLHDEGYRGYQGNENWRGLIYKTNVRDGRYSPTFFDIEDMLENYL